MHKIARMLHKNAEAVKSPAAQLQQLPSTAARMTGESSEPAVRKLPEFAAGGDCANALILQSAPSRHASPELAAEPT
jgi:hypothetical protein